MNVKTIRNPDETFTHLCLRLDYTQKNGLVKSDSDAENEFQKYILKHANEKLGADAVFFLRLKTGQSIPLVYFHKLESRDYDEIAELHKRAWNMGQAPLLYIILPEVVLIYSAYKPPRISNGQLDPKAGFIEELELFVEAKKEIDKQEKYHSSELLTGSYWQKHSKHFQNKKRVYQTLLDNLEFMRNELIANGLPAEVVHNLLGSVRK